MYPKYLAGHKLRSENGSGKEPYSRDAAVGLTALGLEKHCSDGGFRLSSSLIPILMDLLGRGWESVNNYVYFCGANVIQLRQTQARVWNDRLGLDPTLLQGAWPTVPAWAWKPAADKVGWTEFWSRLTMEQRRLMLYRRHARGEPAEGTRVRGIEVSARRIV